MGHEDLIETLAVRLHQGCPLCGSDTIERGCPLMTGCREQARAHATAITDAGWRIVRFERVRPTMVERTERICGEWKP